MTTAMKTVRVPIPLPQNPNASVPVRIPENVSITGARPTSKSAWKRFGRLRANNPKELVTVLGSVVSGAKRKRPLLRNLGAIERKKTPEDIREHGVGERQKEQKGMAAVIAALGLNVKPNLRQFKPRRMKR